jgi:hypothetical protein
MIKLKSIIVVAFIALSMNLQAQTYNFSVSTGTYTDLSDSNSFNNENTWDTPWGIVGLLFDFPLFDDTLTSLHVSDIFFGANGFNNGFPGFPAPTVYHYEADLVDRGYDINVGVETTGSLSNISIADEGFTGSRILKIEWNNVGFYHDLADDGVSDDFTNFQLWIYEETHDFEIRFGPSSIGQPELCFNGGTGPGVALISEFDEDGGIVGEAYMLTGDPSSPVMEEMTSFDDLQLLQGNPPEGTIYRFSRNTTGTTEIQNPLSFSLYPNPVKDYLRVEIENDEIEVEAISILDNYGRLVKLAEANANQIDVSDLVSGVYVVQITTDKGLSTQKLIIE